MRRVAYQAVGGRHAVSESFHRRLCLVLYFTTELLNGVYSLTEITHAASRVEIFKVVRSVFVSADNMVYLHVLQRYLPPTVGAMPVVFLIDQFSESLPIHRYYLLPG